MIEWCDSPVVGEAKVKVVGSPIVSIVPCRDDLTLVVDEGTKSTHGT